MRGGVSPSDPEARLFTRKLRQDLFRLQGASGGGRGERAGAPGRDDPGQCARQPSGRSADPGRRTEGFFADRAYLDSQALRETLERRGLVDGIAWKVKHARYPLEPWQKLHNAWAGSVRSAVERAFATMKRWYGMGRVRYLGLARNACHHRSSTIRHGTMNMKRALVLMRAA